MMALFVAVLHISLRLLISEVVLQFYLVQNDITRQVQASHDFNKVVNAFNSAFSSALLKATLFDLLNGRTTNKEGKEIGYARELYSLYKNDRFSFTLTIVKEILSGLSALHQQGYIHRDLDPSNIMITSDHKVKIIDYGIAKKITALNTQDRQLTNTGQFIGKAEYAAPELVMGDVLSHNQTTDLYAVGIIMFQLINGNPPFKGDMMAVVRKQIHDNLPLHTIPYKILRPILKKACAKRQSQRFQSAQQFLHALNEVEANVSKRADYRKILIYMAIILSIIAFIGLIIYLLLK